MSPLLVIYLAQALVLFVVITRIAYKTKDSCDSAGDAATLAALIALFWPLVVIAFAVVGIPALLFEGVGRLLTIGLRERPSLREG